MRFHEKLFGFLPKFSYSFVDLTSDSIRYVTRFNQERFNIPLSETDLHFSPSEGLWAWILGSGDITFQRKGDKWLAQNILRAKSLRETALKSQSRIHVDDSMKKGTALRKADSLFHKSLNGINKDDLEPISQYIDLLSNAHEDDIDGVFSKGTEAFTYHGGYVRVSKETKRALYPIAIEFYCLYLDRTKRITYQEDNYGFTAIQERLLEKGERVPRQPLPANPVSFFLAQAESPSAPLIHWHESPEIFALLKNDSGDKEKHERIVQSLWACISLYYRVTLICVDDILTFHSSLKNPDVREVARNATNLATQVKTKLEELTGQTIDFEFLPEPPTKEELWDSEISKAYRDYVSIFKPACNFWYEDTEWARAELQKAVEARRRYEQLCLEKASNSEDYSEIVVESGTISELGAEKASRRHFEEGSNALEYPPEIMALMEDWKLSDGYVLDDLNSRFSEKCNNVPGPVEKLLSDQYLKLQSYAKAA